jgi:hypothetical protein
MARNKTASAAYDQNRRAGKAYWGKHPADKKFWLANDMQNIKDAFLPNCNGLFLKIGGKAGRVDGAALNNLATIEEVMRLRADSLSPGSKYSSDNDDTAILSTARGRQISPLRPTAATVTGKDIWKRNFHMLRRRPCLRDRDLPGAHPPAHAGQACFCTNRARGSLDHIERNVLPRPMLPCFAWSH